MALSSRASSELLSPKSPLQIFSTPVQTPSGIALPSPSHGRPASPSSPTLPAPTEWNEWPTPRRSDALTQIVDSVYLKRGEPKLSKSDGERMIGQWRLGQNIGKGTCT